MARGDYTVQEVEALKQMGRDNSFRTCVLTMFIFLALCIILLVIAWTTWRPTSEKDSYSYHSKYGEREHISSLDTEPPVTEFEQQTTRKTHLKEYKTTPHIHLHIKKTTQTTETSATTESRLIRLVALETTETIKTEKSRQTRPTTTELSLPVQVNYTTTTASTTTTTTTTTTQKPLTQSEEYDTTATSVESPLTQLTEGTTTISTIPVTSMQMEQPLTTTAGKISVQVEETSDDKVAHITVTSAQHVNHTTPRVEKSEQQLTTTGIPVHWHLTKTSSMSATGLSDTQHLEYTTKPSPLQSQPEIISSTKNPQLKYKTTNLINSTESTKTTFIAESLQPEDPPTQQHLIYMLVYGKQTSTQSRDLFTSSTFDAGNDSSVSWNTDIPSAESVTLTTVSEKDDISNHSEPEITAIEQLTSSSESSDAETESPFNSLMTPPTTLTNSSATVSNAPVSELSAFTPTNENVTSRSTTAATGLTSTDRSTTPSISTTDSTDKGSATPTSLLTSASSSGPHIQPIYLLIGTRAHTDSTIPTITSTTNSTVINDSSISVIDDLLSQSTPTVQLINISSISTTTGEPIHTAIIEETSAVISNTTASGSSLSVMSTQHSPLTSDKTSTATSSHRNQKIILNATVVTEGISHCTSSACKVLASRMLSLMNHSADPCEDFYEYACGGLKDNRNLLQHDPEYEVWTRIASAVKQIDVHSSEAFKKFNNFYEQCLMFDSLVNKTSRLEQVRKVLNSVGKMYSHTGWAAGNRNLNLTSLLVKLFQLNSAPLFDVQLDVDTHRPSRFLLKLTAPFHQSKFQSESTFAAQCRSQIVPQKKNNVNLKDIYFNKYLPCTRDYGWYMNTTEKALKELGMFKDLEPFHEAQYIKDLRFFIEFEILHHLTELPDAGEMRHILLSKQFMSISVEDLQSKYPLVDWKTLLSALVGGTVSPDTTIQLYFENYFDSLFIKLSEVFNADNKNRMNMHNALLAMFAHDLYVDLVETRSPCNREDYCLKVASGLLEEVSSALYLSTFTREELNTMELELQTLFTQLKFTLQEQFQDVKWLDDSSRSYLTSKLQQLVPITDGGRVFLGDSYLLNERLSEVDMNISNSYLQNAVQLVRRYRSSMFSLYSTEPNLTDTIWTHFLLPYDTQAIAVYQLNIVVIPFGLIGSPQSTPDLPAYVFKARVGNNLARQIAHHFDTTGIEYGSNGKDINLLSDATRYHYSNIKFCDEATYSFEKSWTNQERQIFTYKMEASQSMNERFADSSALHLSYKTFKKNAALEPVLPWLDMSHDKLYYMLVAQELCTKGGMLDYTIQLFESEQMPPFLRVANLAQNSEEFSQAYSCGRGTQMNPEVKCGSFPELREMDGNDSDLSPQ